MDKKNKDGIGNELQNSRTIPNAVVRRLPRYYRILCTLEKKGASKVSSHQLSELTGSTPSQIRQDLNFFGGFGHQGYGYSVVPLRRELGMILGIDDLHGIVLIGCGNLGRAIASQVDFKSTGFRLEGIFDINKKIIGTNVLNITVHNISVLEPFCRENNIDAAIICTPESAVAETAERLYTIGIRNFWNFSHYDIKLEYPDITVENVHLKDSLMVLRYNMNNKADE